jgi:hypothetical protein
MNIYTYISIYSYICIYIYMYLYIYIYINMFMYVYLFIYKNICIIYYTPYVLSSKSLSCNPTSTAKAFSALLKTLSLVYLDRHIFFHSAPSVVHLEEYFNVKISHVYINGNSTLLVSYVQLSVHVYRYQNSVIGTF